MARSGHTDDDSPRSVTRLLADVREGDDGALAELFPLIYDELRELANRQRGRWHGDYTLNTTALVHEAYLKLVDQRHVSADSRAHFLGLAARAMRHILCNYARDRQREKRGGHLRKLSLDEVMEKAGQVPFSDEQAEILAVLDAALTTLESVDARQSKIVECRFFGGLTIEDTAAAVGVSPATVKREWAIAKARLFREMQPQLGA